MSATHLLLNYGKKPVRVLLSSGRLWFAAVDVFHANRRKTDRGLLAHFAPEHLQLETFPSEAGPVRLTAVSPLGVATIASDLPSPQNRALDAWVRREVNMLAETHDLPRLGWTLLADNTLPVRPRATHSGYEAWKVLQSFHPRPRRNPYDPKQPALFDDDPSLPPHDPDAGRAAIAALMAAGAAAIEADRQSQSNSLDQ